VTVRDAIRRREPRLGWEQRRAARWAFDPAVRRQWGFALEECARYVRSRRTLLFGPRFMAPWRDYSIGKVLIRLGIRPVSEPERRDPCAVMAWQDEGARVPAGLFEPLVRRYGRVINSRCLDVGKDNVERVHLAVFGYGMAVDPRVYDEPYVRKSIEQSEKDALVMRGPTEPRPGFVYQRLIDCEVHRGLYEDIRVAVVGRCLGECQVRLRPAETRFGYMPMAIGEKEYAVANIVPMDYLLSSEEVQRVERLAERIGLDFGELDLLRDRADGRIYVVDVNPTVNGPTVVLSASDIRKWFDAYCEATEALLPRFAPAAE
jgi:hypothetical protein